MTTKHTPAPWDYVDDFVFSAVTGEGIADVDYDNDSKINHANAKLIAAAPELLEALIAVENCDGDIDVALALKIHLAIAKATS